MGVQICDASIFRADLFIAQFTKHLCVQAPPFLLVYGIRGIYSYIA